MHPAQHTIRHERMHKRPVIQMNAAFKRIKPGAISRQIQTLTAELESLALAKTGTAKPVNVSGTASQPEDFSTGS